MSNKALPLLVEQRKAKANIFGKRKELKVKPATQRYQYAPVGPEQIRVLSIAIESTTGQLICTFHVRNLASSLGSYRAISYCWGNPTKTFHVLCDNGQVLPITTSCAEILTHVVPRYPKDFFWIDQLCINQEDYVEKSAQVLLMGQIYSSTKQVIAWLGCGDSGSEKAIDYVEGLYKEIDQMKCQGIQPTLQPTMSSEPRMRNMPAEMLRERRWNALSRFLQNPWFERVWVMQEVIMACSKTEDTAREAIHTVISFEKRSVSFDILAEVLSTLERDHLVLNLICDRPSKDGTMEKGVDPPGLGAVRLFSALRERRQWDEPVTLNAALSRTWNFKATDARDKLYALLGFCTDVTDARLRPDYTVSVENVYQTWTEILLEHSLEDGRPLPMGGIGLARSFVNLPSWVPDFSTGSYEIQIRPMTVGGSPGEAYQAWGDCEPTDIIVDRLSSSIHLKGIVVDTVEAVFQQPLTEEGGRWDNVIRPLLLTPDKLKYGAVLHWLEEIQKYLTQSSAHAGIGGAQVMELLSQTIIGNYPSGGANTDEALPRAFDSWYQSQRELAGKDKAGIIATQSRKADFYDQIQAFEDLKALSLQDRPIFGTTRKHFLGFGPKGLQHGDLVCIVKGARMPFLLRKDPNDDNKWNLVGACFVHGLMYGEGLKLGEMEQFLVV
ncbi:MAG: hypothetical protein Q9182_004469 [Xanthomendoza sp. 2 TL-2023]